MIFVKVTNATIGTGTADPSGNTIAKRKSTKGQTRIYKALHIKLKIE
jgi:hypothetical protein